MAFSEWPLRREVEAGAEELVNLYKRGFVRLTKVIKDKVALGYSTKAYNDLAANISETIRQLNQYSYLWVREYVARDYDLAQALTDVELRRIGAELPSLPAMFAQVNIDSIRAIMRDTFEDLLNANKFIESNTLDLLRRTFKEDVETGIWRGINPRALGKEIAQKLISEGVYGVRDKLGRFIPMHHYAKLVAHGKLREAASTGTINRLQGYGYDLVQITYHSNSCPLCIPIEGKIYSISGNHPKWSRLSFRVPLHPFCGHVITPFIEGLSDTDADGNPLSQEEIENEENVLKPYLYELNEKQIEKGLRSNKFQRFFDGELQGVFPVALLDEEYQKILGVKTKTVYLSHRTSRKERIKHKEIGVSDFRVLSDRFKKELTVVQQAKNKLAFIYKEVNQFYLFAISTNRGKDSLILNTFYNAENRTIKQNMKKFKIIRNDLGI